MSKKQKTLPLIEEENQTPCSSKKECACGDTCTCCTEGKCSDSCGCGCGNKKAYSGSQARTFAKCFVALFGSLMITTAILLSAQELKTDHSLQIETYLKNNPSTVYQIVEGEKLRLAEEERLAAEKARLEAEAARAKKMAELKDKIASDASYYSLGNPDGKYVIVEFFDYRCGWCKRTNKALWAEISSGKAPNVRWIPVDSPIFGEASMLISQYVLAAGKQGKYTEMHHAVVDSDAELTAEALAEIGKNIGLDVEQLKKDAESEEIKAKIVSNIELAQEIGVEGVPFMILNGKPHGGALLGAALTDAIAESNK